MSVRQEVASSTDRLLRPWSEIDVSTIVLTVVGAWVAVFVFTRLVRVLEPQLPTRLRYYVLPWPPVFRLVAIATAIVVIVPLILEPKPEAMFALVGSGAVALGFAFKDYISSLIAGVAALFERPYSVGDWVRVGDVYGEVRALRLRVIEVVTPDDDRVSIPHSAIWNDPVHNANSGRPELMCVADFYLHAEHDPMAVHGALEDVALTSAYRDIERPVTVIANEEPFGTHYKIKAYPFDGADQFAFVTDLTLRGKRSLLDLGLRFAQYPPQSTSGK